MIDEALIAAHVGREETRYDVADAERFARLAALLNRSAEGIPALAHFVLFRPDDAQARIGEDGHPKREPDGMLPALTPPRRMWAGSRIRFLKLLPSAAELIRTSRLAAASVKSGKTGEMVFCTVEHEIRSRATGELLISEQQDIVYREAHAGPGLVSRPSIAPEFTPQHMRTVHADPTMLFRYSALTFNAHRIHYDRDYARDVEGYPGLVVQGPYLATLLFDLLTEVEGGRRVLEFSFRAVSPCFDGEDLTFGASVSGDRILLSASNSSGLAMTGQATIANG